MNFIFHQGKPAAPVLVLLHGTGGDERSLLDLGHDLDPQASLLGIRGNVLENGMPRYFKRLAEGIYDEEDLMFRGKNWQHSFKKSLKKKVSQSNKLSWLVTLMEPILRSIYCWNSVLFFKSDFVPSNVSSIEITQSLTGTNKRIYEFGSEGPYRFCGRQQVCASDFESRGAQIEYVWTPSHQLTYQEVEKSRKWLEKAD